MVLLIGDETHTYWDHVTGRAVHGALAGAQLDTWPLHYLNVKAATGRWPGLRVLRKRRRSLADRLLGVANGSIRGGWTLFPPGFRGTMADVDPSLPEMTPGLAVLDGDEARFFPMALVARGVTLDWRDDTLKVSMDATEGLADARWTEPSRPRPMQLMMRWYGFNLTWPHGVAVQ